MIWTQTKMHDNQTEFRQKYHGKLSTMLLNGRFNGQFILAYWKDLDSKIRMSDSHRTECVIAMK